MNSRAQPSEEPIRIYEATITKYNWKLQKRGNLFYNFLIGFQYKWSSIQWVDNNINGIIYINSMPLGSLDRFLNEFGYANALVGSKKRVPLSYI